MNLIDNLRNIEQKQIDAAIWWKRLKETNNETFLPLFFDKHRFLVLKGGGGSGKSIFAGRKVLERCVSERGHRFLVCRKVARTLRESCFRQLCSQAFDFYADANPVINKSDMRIRFQNGSEILFAGLDDVEKLKSIYNITSIWIEEASELLESDLNQLNIRLRGQTQFYKQIILTFNPISITHWLKNRFFDQESVDVRTHSSNYKDNRFLPAEDIAVLESFKNTDRYYYDVYCLGNWGVLGKTIFDAEAISHRLEKLVQPVRVGYFDYDYDGLSVRNIKFTDDKNGFVKIYREPEAGHPYVIGGDTAGEGSDKFVGQVIDNTNAVQVATLRHTFDEDVYARQIYCLGMYYNAALVGIESNFSTYPNKELERLEYPKLYVRETEDSFTKKIGNTYGFKTTSLTRPLIIAGLVHVARENINVINDETTLHEMLTFVRNEKMKPEAEAGAHDDCIMALAIAYHIRPQQSAVVDIEKVAKAKWEPDMFEDYYAASPQDRRYLIEKWGNPF